MKVRSCLRLLAWMVLVFFTGLLIYNGLPYLHSPKLHAFVWEKGALAERPLWIISLVIHVVAGMVCLLSSLLQFYRPLLRRVPWLHRWLGRVYVASVLLFLSPTGFYLAFYAHGGWAGTLGFLILGILTVLSTWNGWIHLRRGKIQGHIRWMIRSFAMVTTALSFRVEHIIFQELGFALEAAFLAALYLSIFGNALVAEVILWLAAQKKNKQQTKRINHEANHKITVADLLS